MEQHAVPQNISSYEFKLVGDMTLKQFLELAGGVVVGLIFWSLPLPVIVRAVLVFFSVLFGVLMAFVPINGRTFGQWVLAFFRAVYSPTEYYWQQSSTSQTIVPTKVMPPPASPVPEVKDQLDQKESQLVSRISTLFNPPLVAEVARQATAPPPQAATTQYSQASPKPASPPPPAIAPPPKPKVQEPPPPQSTINDQRSTAPPFYSPLTPMASHTASVASPTASAASSVPTPAISNILAGAITDPSGNTLDGVIVEITDSSTGIPVRALRTNRLGQFQIATPLLNGSYTIQAEKEGLTFAPVTISATGKIIQPILIKSNA